MKQLIGFVITVIGFAILFYYLQWQIVFGLVIAAFGWIILWRDD
jgi:hypothetical protein